MTMTRAARFAVVFSLFAYGLFVPQAESQAPLTNTWAPAGQMTQARTGAAAVQLTDKRILITGGTDGSGVPQAAVEAFNPATGVFTALPAMNVPRANHAAVVLESGDVLVTGGLTTGGSYSDSAEIYSITSGKWTLLSSPIGAGLEGQAMVLLPDGNVLIAGGTSTTKVVSSLVLFNHSDETFTSIGTLLTARTNAAAAATQDGRVLIVGGSDINGAALASTEIFAYSTDTMTGTISAGPAMTYPRVNATATGTYDGVAVIGGNNGQNDLGTAEIFSQWTNTFKVVSGGTPRSRHFAVLLPKNGSILAMGGTGGTAVDLLEPWANNKAGAFVAATASLVNQDGGFAAPASLGSLLAAGGMGSGASAAELYWFPTVSTDKAEYAPGTPVNMSGSGFQPLETIDLHLHLWVDQTTEDVPDATATADSLGNFSYDGYAPNTGDIGARYHLTAVGLSSGYQAQTIFGDSTASIIFTSAPLDQATGVCGEITISQSGTAPFDTLYLIDSTGTGTFYSSSSCTGAAITSVGAAQTVNVWYKNTAAGNPVLTACSINAGSQDACELAQALGLAMFGAQTEIIYGTATQLAWAELPGGGAPGVAWAQQPAVEVLDASGNKVSASAASITLALSTDPGGGALTCTANPAPAVSGIAQFAGCSINLSEATQYCITASSPGLKSTGPTAACFYVEATNAANSTVTASPITVAADGVSTSTITVTLLDGNKSPVSGATVALGQGAGASTINPACSTCATTNSSGVATFTVTDATVQSVIYTATDTTNSVTITQTATVSFTAPGTTLLLAVPSPNFVSFPVAAAVPVTLTATLTDTATGAPLAGVTVTFNISTASGGTGTAVTGANGVATYTGYSVPTTAPAGALTVTASSPLTVISGVTYAAGTGSPAQIINVGGTVPTLRWSTAPPASAAYLGTFTILATSNSSGMITYSVTGACTINTATRTVTMTSGTGSCYVSASQAAKTTGTTYDAATLGPTTVTATMATQAPLTVTGAPASAALNTTFTVGTSGGSGTGAVTFAATGSCTVSGNVVTMTSGSGTCSVTATKAADNNYNSATSAAVTVTATAAAATVVVTCPTAPYNGAPQTTCTATTSPTLLTVTYTYNGISTVPTNAGSYTVVGSIGSGQDYSGTSLPTTFVISPEPVTATAGTLAGAAYTGSTYTIPPCSLSGAFTTNLTCADSPTTVGPAPGTSQPVTPVVTAISPDTLSNYAITYVNGSWTIGTATTTVTVTCSTVTYNGAPQTTACSATTTPSGLTPVTFTYNGSPTAPTAAGTYSVVGTYLGGGNYLGSTGTGSLTISPAPVTVTAGTLASTPYTGAAIPIPLCVVSGPYTGTVTCTETPTSETAAGTGTVTPVASVGSGDSASNYAITLVTGTWTITQPTATVMLSNLTQTYTGSPLPVTVTTSPPGLTVVMSYVGIDGTTYGPLPTAPTDPGSYTVTATINDLNYVGSATGTETINQASVVWTLAPQTGQTATSTYGTMLYFNLTVTLNGTTPAICPTGSVQFYVNPGVPSGAAVALNPTTCSAPVPFDIATLDPGTYGIYAVYSGDGNYSTVTTSPVLAQTVDVDATEVALGIVQNPVNVGGTVTFTATVAPSVALASSANGPDGTVSFYVCPSGTASCTASNGTELSGAAVTLSGTSPYTAVLPLVADAADSLGEGSYAIGATYTSSDGEFTGSSTTVSLTVGLNASVIAWTPTPTSITYGTPLIAAQLDATATDQTTHAPVPGTFTYYFPAGTVIQTGTVLPTGMDDLQVTFTPEDGTTYASNSASATLTVTPATLTVTADPQTMVYGGTVPTPLTATITGFVNTDPSTVVTGTAACLTTATSTSPAGTYPITCSLGSLAASNYVFSFTPGTLTVTAGTTLTILTLPTASSITYGQTLASSVLGTCTGTYDGATVPGSCAWTTSGTVPPGGSTATYSVTFTPTTNPGSYSPLPTAQVLLTVNPATPTISTLPTASPISSGQPLSSSTLLGGTVTSGPTTVTGKFTWTTGTIVPAVGTDPESVTFTPDNTADYNSVTTTVNVTVNNKGTPTVTDWPTASGITYGATLSTSTLTPFMAVVPGSAATPGSASVAGTFTWSNGGLIPGAGSDSESVTFTPTDVADYNTVGGYVTVVVSKATPTISTLPTASTLSAGQALSASKLLGGIATSGTSTVAGSFTWTTGTIVPPTGSTPEGVTFTPTDTADYSTVTTTVTVTVNSKGTPTVTAWPTASAIYYDQTLLSSVLTGGTASVLGTFNWTNSGLLPTAGTDLESVTFTPNDTTDYNTVINTVSVTVYKVTPTITAPPTPSAISVGQTLNASTLVGGTVSYNGTTVAGTFTWTTPGTTPPAGSDVEGVTFTPNDTTDFYTLTTTVTVVVNNKTTPTITAPPTATGITFGQTLASSTLSGGTASVGGSFAWTTSTTAPGAGTPTESVTFTPTNTILYNTVTTTITLAVSKATPTITVPPTASAITVGQALSASTLTGGTATSGGTTVTGSFTWTTGTIVPPSGSTAEGVTFTPTDTADYNSATTTVTVTAGSKTTPTITAPPTATGITYGETLASSTLSGGTASVAGSFAWTTSTTAPGVGTPSESVTFTPTNTALYNTATTTVTLTVSKATPTVSTLPTASAISVGQALSASTLSGGIATSGGTTVAGSFTWTTGTNVPPTGSTPEGVTFTPTDTADYNTATTTVTVTVNNKTTPTITAPPTATGITYGETLASSTISGGTVSSGGTTLTGSFAWTTSTTAPGAGTPTESVTFTPTDTTDYNTVTTTITVTVSKATPTVSTLPTASALTTGQALSASILLGGIATSGTTTVDGLFTWTTGTTVPPTGSTPEGVTFTPTDTTDYNTATTTVTVTVNGKGTPTVTAWPTASAIYYDQTLLSSVLTGGTASVLGTFTWTNSGLIPTAGTDLESVTFTPNDTTDYSTVTNTVSVTVYKVTPTITVPPTASTIGTGQTLASSTLLGGTATSGATTVAGLFTWTTPAIAPPLGTTSESVTFTPSDTADYNTATGSVSVTVNGKTTPTVTAWPTASTIGLGQTLASSTLSGGTASVGGSFTWTAPATAPPLGTTAESVTFTPSDTTDYNTVTGPVSVTVSSSVQAISFSTPAQVAYGTAPMLLSATGGASGNPVTFLIVSGPGSLNGNTLVITGVGTITISANQAGNSNYSAATQVMQSIVVTPVALTLTANNATKVYGTPNPALTGTVTGAVNGDAFTDSFLTSATSTSGAGDYVIVPSATGTNIADYNVTLQVGMLTITQAGTTTTLNLSNPTLDPGQSVTLTALVAPATTGTPTGSVSFYDGTTLLNTAPLSGGTATYTVSGYSAGTTHQLTAVYSGDTNFLSSSTGSSIQLGVASLDFTIAVTGSATSTVSPGSSATYQLTVSPLYGSYPGQVSFAAAGLPSTTTTTFSPSAIAAGAGPQTVTMTVQTSAAAKLAYPEIGRKLAPIAFALLLIPLFGGGRLRRQARRMSKLASILLLLGCTLVGAMMTGCGGAAFQQLSQQYTITVTATSGNLQHTAPVTLMIK